MISSYTPIKQLESATQENHTLCSLQILPDSFTRISIERSNLTLKHVLIIQQHENRQTLLLDNNNNQFFVLSERYLITTNHLETTATLIALAPLKKIADLKLGLRLMKMYLSLNERWLFCYGLLYASKNGMPEKEDTTIVYDIKNGKILTSLPMECFDVSPLPLENEVLIGTPDGMERRKIQSAHLQKLGTLPVSNKPTEDYFSIQLLADNQTLVTAHEHNQLRVWNIQPHSNTSFLTLTHTSLQTKTFWAYHITKILEVPNQPYLLTFSHDTLHLWHLEKTAAPKLIERIKLTLADEETARSFTLTPDWQIKFIINHFNSSFLYSSSIGFDSLNEAYKTCGIELNTYLKTEILIPKGVSQIIADYCGFFAKVQTVADKPSPNAQSCTLSALSV